MRLDGPVAFWWCGRLFVIARKHLPGSEIRKRTALYELTGNLERGPLEIHEWGELPSAGDTSYAGIARIHGPRFLTTWYSSPPAEDPSWLEGFAGQTDIWRAKLDLSRLPKKLPPAITGWARRLARDIRRAVTPDADAQLADFRPWRSARRRGPDAWRPRPRGPGRRRASRGPSSRRCVASVTSSTARSKASALACEGFGRAADLARVAGAAASWTSPDRGREARSCGSGADVSTHELSVTISSRRQPIELGVQTRRSSCRWRLVALDHVAFAVQRVAGRSCQPGGPASASRRANAGLPGLGDRVGLREHRKRDPEVRLAEVGDLAVRAWRLTGDVVGGAAEDSQSRRRGGHGRGSRGPRIGREPALRCRVDDEHDLPAVRAQALAVAIEERQRLTEDRP